MLTGQYDARERGFSWRSPLGTLSSVSLVGAEVPQPTEFNRPTTSKSTVNKTTNQFRHLSVLPDACSNHTVST
jgi:hypothetical protein